MRALICCGYCDADHFLLVFPYYNFQDNNQQMQKNTNNLCLAAVAILNFPSAKNPQKLWGEPSRNIPAKLVPNDLVVSEISEKIKMWNVNDDGRMPCDGINLHDPFGSDWSNELKVIFYLYIYVLVKSKINSPIK